MAGKGFGASLLMASVKAMTPFIAAEHGVAQTLRELNRRLFGGLGRGQFVAFAYARISPSGDSVEIANAGMPDPFLLEEGSARPLSAPGPRLPLGIRAEVPYESITCPLGVRARLLLYSDGLAEAPRPSGEALGYESLAALLARSVTGESRPLDEWLDEVLEEIQAATGPALDDDWTAVAVERRNERRQGA